MEILETITYIHINKQRYSAIKLTSNGQVAGKLHYVTQMIHKQ